MMEDHENEERELTGGMERALAAAIAAAASLIEAFQRRQAQRDREAARQLTNGDRGDNATDTNDSIKEQVDIQTSARAALAAGREDAQFWRTAPIEQLHEQIIAEHGIDPRRVGEPAADSKVLTGALGADVLSVYAAADRWAGLSEVAAEHRANIAAELAAYGLDVDELTSQPPGTAAEQIHNARAQHWADRGYDPQGTSAEQAEAARDGEQVEQLVTQANAMDRRRDQYADYSDEVRAAGDRMAADPARAVAGVSVDKSASRAEQISTHRGNTSAGKAAAAAAIDHPTNPRDAPTATSRPAARPAARPAPARERGHGR